MNEQGEKKGFLSRSAGKPWVLVLAFVLTFWLGSLVGGGKLASLGQSGGTNNNNLPENLDYSSVEEVYDVLRENYNGKLTSDQLEAGLKKGLAESTGDPYTEYFTASEAEEFQSDIENSFSGIGAELGKDADDNLIIVAPISGFPAEKAGLRAQDIVVTINGESTANLSIDQAVKKIRGEKGTDVKLQIVRNKAQSLDFTTKRDDIRVKSVEWEVLEGNIGKISIRNFSTDTSELIAQAASDLRSKNVKGIVLDLRNNPGGILDSSVTVAEQWLPSGKKILEEKRGAVVIKTYTSEGPGTLAGIPTAVLINEGSASASEIVAGALRDNNAARLIGEKTYGKGVVQQPICISGSTFRGGCEGDLLKVTVASWFRPNGQNINKKGINPDQKVELTEQDIEAQKDPQQDAALRFFGSR